MSCIASPRWKRTLLAIAPALIVVVGAAALTSSALAPPLQLPQLRVPPQPSLASPHSSPNERQVSGVHGGGEGSTHTPPSHAWPLAQPPQFRVPAQPSLALPHSMPIDEQLSGTQGGGPGGETSTQTPPLQA